MRTHSKGSVPLSGATHFGRQALRAAHLMCYYDSHHDLRYWDIIHPDIVYMGPISDEIVVGIEAFKKSIATDFIYKLDRYEEKYRLLFATEDKALVSGSYLLQFSDEEPLFFMMRQRFTVFFVKVEGRPRTLHLHVSDPDNSRDSDTQFSFNAGLELRAFIARLHSLSVHDHMTGLYSRNYLESEYDRFNALFLQGQGFVLYCDLNGFKQVNDRFGHDRGDEALTGFAEALKDSVSAVSPDTFAVRMGGDEFLCFHPTQPWRTGLRILRVLREECAEHWGELGALLSVSAGLVHGRMNLSLNELISIAERRMRHVKQRLRKSGAIAGGL